MKVFVKDQTVDELCFSEEILLLNGKTIIPSKFLRNVTSVQGLNHMKRIIPEDRKELFVNNFDLVLKKSDFFPKKYVLYFPNLLISTKKSINSTS